MIGPQTAEKKKTISEKRKRTRESRLVNGLNYRQQEFCRLVVSGIPQGRAYAMAGYGAKNQRNMDRGACNVLSKPGVTEYIKALKEKYFSANAMSVAEKRDFLGRLTRTPIAQITPESDLCQGAVYGVDDQGNRYLKELKIPGKLQAIELDSRLAGDLNPDVQVNVGVQLINDRILALENAELEKAV